LSVRSRMTAIVSLLVVAIVVIVACDLLDDIG
jgi:hypothetical protein